MTIQIAKAAKRRPVGRPRTNKAATTVKLRPELKTYARRIGARTTSRGQITYDLSEGIARALEFYRAHHNRNAEATDSNGWPNDFFEKVAGQWSGSALARPEQGAYPLRLELH